MLRCLAIIALLAASLANAIAADLAAQSRLGAIYAEPAPAPPRARAILERPIAEPRYVYAPEVDVRPIVGGYYGKPNSYLYQSYYGTSPFTIFGRLPYACGWHGYC